MPKVMAKMVFQIVEQPQVNRIAPDQPQAFEHRQVAPEPDGEYREDDVERHGEGELEPRQCLSAQSCEHESSPVSAAAG